jgi:SsrA-binding protein
MVQQKGYSLIPISLYFKRNFVKVELGIGRGKKLYDKRQDMAKKESERRIERAMKQNF